MVKKNKGSGFAVTAIILAILAVVMLQMVSVLMSIYYNKPPVFLGPALSIFFVLGFVILPFKYIFQSRLNSFKDLVVVILAVVFIIVLIKVFPMVVPSVFKQSFSVLGLG